MNSPKKIIENPFTDYELTLLNGHYVTIANVNTTTGAYVGQIASGKKAANSAKAQKILTDLNTLLKALKAIANPSETVN